LGHCFEQEGVSFPYSEFAINHDLVSRNLRPPVRSATILLNEFLEHQTVPELSRV
jgi:hypothetical protein